MIALPKDWNLYIADPEPKVYSNRLYVFGSCDEDQMNSSQEYDWCSARYHVVYTDDMKSWIDAGISFSLDKIPNHFKPSGAHALWAPDVIKSPKTETFHLYSCFNGECKGPILVSESQDPTGPYTNPIPLKLNNKPVCNIDPAVFTDDNGATYISWPFIMAQIDPSDFSKVLPETTTDMTQWMPTVEGIPFEGPSIRKRQNIYYYIYIENSGPRRLSDGSENISPTRMVYMTATHPLGPYIYRGIIIANTGFHRAINIHGSIVEFQNQWYVFYHMPASETSTARAMCFEPIIFNEAGLIQPVSPTPVLINPK